MAHIPNEFGLKLVMSNCSPNRGMQDGPSTPSKINQVIFESLESADGHVPQLS